MEVVCRKVGCAMIAALSGELDHHNAASVREELEERFAASGARDLIFDLSALRFMDSSGLGILIGRYKTVSALGGKTKIAAPSGEAERLIRLAGIHRIIPIWKNVNEAVEGR